jgi:hypothetical protein
VTTRVVNEEFAKSYSDQDQIARLFRHARYGAPSTPAELIREASVTGSRYLEGVIVASYLQ